MDKIKTVKIKNEDGTVSEESYSISVDATNVDMSNGRDLQDTVGNIDVDKDGNIASQLNNLNNNIKKKVFYFNTITDMKNANLKEGDVATTLGYYEPNDSGGAEYLITNDNLDTDYGSVIKLNNNLKAVLIIKNNTVTAEQFGLIGDGITDNSERMKNLLAFKKNDYIKIIFSKNKIYGMQKIIYFYSNTEIDLNQASLKCLYTGGPEDSYVSFANGLRFFANVESVKILGYGAIKNFHIYNGTLDGGNSGITFAILHGENFSWKNIKFYNCSVGTHIVDMGGCKNFLFEDCLFTGSWITGTNNYREMLQPDYATNEGLPYWGNDASFAFDALPTINLTVRGCTFEKGEGTHYPNAIGTHSANTAFPENFLIENCTFHDCTYSAIRLPHIKGVKIINNTFYNENPNKTGDMFMINFIGLNRAEPSGEDILIEGNTFKSLLGNELGDDNTICIGIIKHANNTTWFKNIQIINNNIYGTYQRAPEDMGKEGASTSSIHIGQDFLQIRGVEQLDIINNRIIQMKQLIYVSDSTLVKNIRIKNNYMENMRSFVRCGSNVAQKVNGSIIEDNIWTAYDSTGINKNTYNLNHQSFMWSLSEPTKDIETDGFQSISLTENMSDANEFIVDSNGYIRIPHYIKKFKVKIQLYFYFDNKYGTENQIVTTSDGNWWMNLFCRQYQNLGIGTSTWSFLPTGQRMFIPKDAKGTYIVELESPIIDYSGYWNTDKNFSIGIFANVYHSLSFRRFLRSTSTQPMEPDALGTYLTIEAC